MTSEAEHGVCLYRRVAGDAWWRVDAYVTPSGGITIISGDANEWSASVAPEHAEKLLIALRREGDLAPSIGGSPRIEILHRLHLLFHREADAPSGPFEEIKTFLDGRDIPWTAGFWAGDVDEPSSEPGRSPFPAGELWKLLGELRDHLGRPGNDFTWSWWDDAEEALAEFDALATAMDGGGGLDPEKFLILLAPSGPLQDVALASGWSSDFLALAARIEAAFAGSARRRGS